MNSESPFRISSTVLTIACVLCGITAAAYCVSRFNAQRTAHDSSDVVVNLQYRNYAEFQKSVRSGRQQSEPEVDAARRSRSIQEPSSWLGKSGPINNSGTQHAVSSRGGMSPAPRKGDEFIRSTGFERNASSSSPPPDAVPNFYAPVTVHPVTVNIDNSAIIREIARLHERLDSITDHPSAVEVLETAENPAPLITPPLQPETPSSTRRFEYTVHNKKQEVPPDTPSDVVQNQHATSDTEFLSPPDPAPQTKAIPQRLPVKASTARHQSRRPTPPAVVAPAPSAEQIPPAMPILSFPEPVSEPTPEPAIEIVPQQPVPTFEFDEPSTAVPQTDLPMIVPSIEFSTDLLPVPEPASNPESAVRHEASGESAPLPPVKTIERTAYCAPVNQSRHSESPASPEHLTSCYETAKRTTNPPFMNGVRPDIPLPLEQTTLEQTTREQTTREQTTREQTTRESRRHVAQVSHQVREPRLEVSGPREHKPEVTRHDVPPSEVTSPNCRNCKAKAETARAYRIQAVTPPPILKRLTSLMQ